MSASAQAARLLGRRERLPALLVPLGVIAALLVLGGDRLGGRGGGSLDATGDVLRALAAALGLFTAAGYAPARVLAPAALRPYLPLLVLPVGAVVSALALTALGFFRLPLEASLAVVIGAGVAGGAVARMRGGPLETVTEGLRWRVVLPACAAALAVAVPLGPLFQRDSFATIQGQNGDAHLVAGSAVLLQHAPPTAIRPELPVDRIPVVWRSKYPIYYSLAGVSTLSGLDPIEAFPTLSALLVGLLSIGFFLFARLALGAGRLGALAAGALVPLDWLIVYLALHPFYNQLWGLVALPFTLVFGWLFLRRPTRGALALLALFGAIGAFAYPLLLPFLLLFLAVVAWLEWRERSDRGERPGWVAALRLPRGRRSLLLWVPAAILAVPVAALLLFGVAEKVDAAVRVLLPGSDLEPWSAPALGEVEVYRFFGLIGPPVFGWICLALLAGAAVLGLRGAPRSAGRALAATVAALVVAGLYFQVRDGGELFYFRALGFAGPLVVALAAVGVARQTRREAAPAIRAAAAAALAGLALVFAVSVRREVRSTFPFANAHVLELREWSERLPNDSSVRVDVVPYGFQQWAAYMMSDHPVSALSPLKVFFPYPPPGRKADFLLVNSDTPRPPDAAGAPLLRNPQFALYRMRRDVPGPDVSSLELLRPID